MSRKVIKLSELQEKQPISIIGFIGSVGAGKTTVVEKLSHILTLKHSKELKNGCSINMGYVNIKIFYNKITNKYLINPIKTEDLTGYTLCRHFSIADNPGHNEYMTTTLTGINIVDNIIFLVSGIEGITSQSIQHLKCYKTTDCKQLCILITKVDLVKTAPQLEKIKNDIYELLDNINIDGNIDPPIIPISSQNNINMSNLIDYLVSSQYPIKLKTLINKPFIMPILRSFDINNVGIKVENMMGATIGGAIEQGYLLKGDIISIWPGIIKKIKGGYKCIPLYTKVVQINTNNEELDYAVPGGFIGIRTTLDPGLAKANHLVGNIIVKENNIVKIANMIKIRYDSLDDKRFVENNEYILNFHCSTIKAKLVSININELVFIFDSPIAVIDKQKVVIMSNNLLICYGEVIEIYTDPNVIILQQPDLNTFLKNQKINQETYFEIIDDLDVINCSQNYNNFEENISKITFNNINQTTNNILPIKLIKTTNSIILTNLLEIFSDFVESKSKQHLLMEQFSQYIINHKKNIKNSTISIDHEKISFGKIRNTANKGNCAEFNKLLFDFLIQYFKCAGCGCCAIYMSDKKTECSKCNTIAHITLSNTILL